MSKRIAVFLPNLTGGGAERVGLHLANGLAKCDYKVDLVLSQAKGPYVKFVDKGVNLVDLKCSDGFSTLKSFFKIVRYLKENKPNVMFSTLFRANYISYLAIRWAGVDTRLVVRHPNMLYPKDSVENLYSRLLKKLAVRAAKKADAVVLTSQLMKKELLNLTYVDDAKIYVIPNPVPIEEITKKASKPLKHEWFELESPPVILSVGRLTVQKNYSNLILAFNEVIKNTPARLVILGEGEKRNELEALVDKLGLKESVSLPGFVDNPYQYMSRAKIFVLPSKWEGFPNVLVEAMACGAQVVATDCPGGTAEILEGGKWGRLVQTDSFLELAHKIENTLSSSNFSPVKSRVDDFKIDKIIDEYIKVFRINEKSPDI